MSVEKYTPARWAQVDMDNPDVWTTFVYFSFEKIRQGATRYSAWAVMNRVRWETEKIIIDRTEFKIANGWIAFYARKFMDVYPLYIGFFDIRSAVADKAYPQVAQAMDAWRLANGRKKK